MRRITLAMTLGLGLGMAVPGCGPTADPAAAPAAPVLGTPAKDNEAIDGSKPLPDVAAKDPAKDPAKAGAPKKSGGGGGPGIPDDMMKQMKSGAYRNQTGSQGPGDPPKTDGKAADKPADDKKDAPAKPADGEKKDPVTLSDEEIKNIKMLPDAADQKLALAQKVCLVGDPNHLGEMGVPVKEVVKGKTVFLCCKSCVEDLKKDPDKYLAKLAK